MKLEKYDTKSGQRWRVFEYIGTNKDGKVVTIRKKGFKTKKEAKLYAEKQIELYKHDKNNYLTQKNPINNEVTFKEVYKQWLISYEKTVEKTTFSRTKDLFKLHILPEFGNLKINEITTFQCQKWINSKNFVNIKQLKSYGSQVMEYAIDMNFRKDPNPFDKVRLPNKDKIKGTRKRIPSSENFWNIDELTAFLNYLRTQDDLQTYALFHLLASSGARKVEIAALKWSDIDFTNNCISINKNLAHIHGELFEKSPKNKFSDRTILLPSETFEILKIWKVEQEKLFKQDPYFNLSDAKNYLFTYVNKNNELKPIYSEYADHRLKTICKKLNLRRITVHGLRHTIATLLHERNINIVSIAQLLGHANESETLKTYTHSTIRGSEQINNALGNILNTREVTEYQKAKQTS